MSSIALLKTPFVTLSPEEQDSFIRGVRRSRRTSKGEIAKKEKKRAQSLAATKKYRAKVKKQKLDKEVAAKALALLEQEGLV